MKKTEDVVRVHDVCCSVEPGYSVKEYGKIKVVLMWKMSIRVTARPTHIGLPRSVKEWMCSIQYTHPVPADMSVNEER